MLKASPVSPWRNKKWTPGNARSSLAQTHANTWSTSIQHTGAKADGEGTSRQQASGGGACRGPPMHGSHPVMLMGRLHMNGLQGTTITADRTVVL